jgi:hypothetical protein
MPPQGSCSIPQILQLFFSHAAKVEIKKGVLYSLKIKAYAS